MYILLKKKKKKECKNNFDRLKSMENVKYWSD